MNAVGVIPARYGAVRFPGKILASILGRPLLSWVIEGVQTSRLLKRILVATDDERILNLARSMGVDAVMTSSDLPSGSDRVWAAVQSSPEDIVINIQGDEPLVSGREIDQLIEAFQNPVVQMATLGRNIKSEEELVNNNVAKIVVDRDDFAIYFSRFPIPYSRNKDEKFEGCLKHIGFYGYRKKFLGEFCQVKSPAVEKAEGLEQLRALWMGAKIKVLRTNADSWGVDSPEDIAKVEKMLKIKLGAK